LHGTFISKLVCHHFGLGLIAWQHRPPPKKKKILPSLAPLPRKKKIEASLVHVKPFIAYMQFLFPKLLTTIFTLLIHLSY
jgi:hypothetical protein